MAAQRMHPTRQAPPIARRAQARYDGPPCSMLSRAGFESEYPFPSKFFDLDGVRYHYVDEGQGEILLCVHGNPTWSFAWRNIIKDLSRDFRVLAIDHVGCGFSDKPQNYEYRLAKHVDNLSRFIAGLNLTQITLLGHDWGGAIGMGAAGAHPERFARLVLFNTAAYRSQQIPWRIAICRWPILGPVAVRGLNLFARAGLTMAVCRHERMTPAVRAGYLAPYGNWHDRVAILRFVQDIPLAPAHPSYAALVTIEDRLALFQKTPLLLVWGMRDWCFTPTFLKEFERRFPQAEVLQLSQAGHYVFEDAHEEIIPRLQTFLQAHPLPS
jgi:haloalkane dehalogenase